MTLNLALTPGEPSGVGPDVLIQLVQQKQHQQPQHDEIIKDINNDVIDAFHIDVYTCLLIFDVFCQANSKHH